MGALAPRPVRLPPRSRGPPRSTAADRARHAMDLPRPDPASGPAGHLPPFLPPPPARDDDADAATAAAAAADDDDDEEEEEEDDEGTHAARRWPRSVCAGEARGPLAPQPRTHREGRSQIGLGARKGAQSERAGPGAGRARGWPRSQAWPDES
eukprot:scaffold2740_cov418-Prasinococcus_capsulatus_cf.AAC.5